jgi:hypothetical protein
MQDKSIFPMPDGSDIRRIPKSFQIYRLAKAGTKYQQLPV